MRNGVIAVALLALTAAGPALADPADEMMEADRAFAAMAKADGMQAAFLAYMTEDVRLFAGPKRPIVGKAAVAAYYASPEGAEKPGSRLAWEPVEAEASGDGSMGFTRGTWTYSEPDAAGTLKELANGYYVTVWRREGGGYKFVLDIGGSDPRPAAD